MGGCGWSSVIRCGACGGGASLLGAKPRPHVMWAPAGSGGASVAEGDMFLFQEKYKAKQARGYRDRHDDKGTDHVNSLVEECTNEAGSAR